MSSEIAVRLSGISKSYGIYKSSAHRLKTLLFSRRSAKTFTALSNVDVEIGKGEFVGIIGRNGSGKSTLLQIMAGILSPTTGTVAVNGRIAAMLELGAGFNPDFTGRENARLNAQILGLTSTEIDAAMPEIESFADIGEFFDRPVVTYSSGMFVRLAFAVQAAVKPDVLIIDEALAVGDVFFRIKCYERLNRLRERGCTVILVTHSAEDIMYYCDRAFLFDHGHILYEGDPTEAVNRYYALGQDKSIKAADAAPTIDVADGTALGSEIGFAWPQQLPDNLPSDKQLLDGAVAFLGAGTFDSAGRHKHIFHQGDTMMVMAEYLIEKDIGAPCAGVVLRTDRGIVLHGRHTGQSDTEVPLRSRKGERLRVWHEIKLDVGSGEYVIDIGLSSWPTDMYSNRSRFTMSELEGAAQRHSVATSVCRVSVVPPSGRGFAAQPFYGLADLRSTSRLVTGARIDKAAQ
jgi:lipopolysaccharide transport system ATP-binding protein